MVIINNIVTDKIVSGAAKLQENGRVSWPPQPGVSEVKSGTSAFSDSVIQPEQSQRGDRRDRVRDIGTVYDRSSADLAWCLSISLSSSFLLHSVTLVSDCAFCHTVDWRSVFSFKILT